MAAPPRNRTTEEKAHVDNDALQRFCGAWRDMQCSRRGGGGGDAFVVGAVYHIAEDLTDITLMDAYSGEVVRRMDGLSRPGLRVCAGGDMICVVSPGDGLLRVVDVATGDLTDLSMGCSAATGRNVSSGYTLGKVPATGEHKLLHVYAAANGSQSSETSATAGSAPTSGLAALDGRLVAVHHDYPGRTINLWSLTPNDTTWTKLHSLPIRNVLRGWEEEPTSHPAAAAEAKRGGRSKKRKKKKEEEVRWLCREKVAQPLAMVGDGRMAVWARGCEGAVRLHDPRTGACEEVAQVEKCGCVLGFYSGALSPSHAVEMEE
ncbi:hypothetical protein OsJ_23444 [Oryza sativa Japonica Group]|uniref:Uncharacterized protein n=1 Tax=Oryza sativa subsp. japonica TaxID=39947 RepID=A3BHI4_ORYSJ|nr:hypothetical protein OsJ_23444 [Oryza sativa Japonica Group]